MKRRKAIEWLFVGGLTASSGLGLKWLSISRKPEIAYLATRMELLAQVVDVIIPATSTPGAKEAGAHEFVLKALADCTQVSSVNNFLRGIKELENYSYSVYSLPFTSCTPDQQKAILTYFEKKVLPLQGILGKVKHKLLGKPFFTLLKEYTVLGYYTSETGARSEISYNYIPGAFSGNISIRPGQKSWATE